VEGEIKMPPSNLPHKLPSDLSKALNSSKQVKEKWNSLTPLAKNEWICWVISVKTPETRTEHVRRVVEDLMNGKRRPCCWAGCVHRKR
jgi:uncharacterized protein YdeI (YjbR/CyaY-like superfamily)